MIRVPAEIAFLVDAAGVDATLRFIEAEGGGRVRVASDWRHSELATLYGDEIASALSRRYGYHRYDVPVMRAWRVSLYLEQGLTVSDAARRAGVTRRAVFKILKTDPDSMQARKAKWQDDRQILMF